MATKGFWRRLIAGASLSLCALGAAHAQTPGSQDLQFASGPQADSAVVALAVQPNGQVLAAGLFTQFRGQPRNCVARLNPDGSLDSFDPGLAFSAYETTMTSVYAIAVQPDGKIIVGGYFDVLNQTPGSGVARLNFDGSLDTAFNAGAGAFDNGFAVGRAYSLALLPNGQILVGGDFQSFNGVPLAGLVRLNADGSVDTTFNAGGSGITPYGFKGVVSTIAVQSNGQIVIGGSFATYNGVAEGCVARLNADGTLDQSFNGGAGADGMVNAVAVQPNGQVLVGGNFQHFDGASILTDLVRLNTDGTLDSTYIGWNALFVQQVDAIVLQPDGEAIIGGAYLNKSGGQINPHNGVMRVLASGLPDTGFDSGDSSDAGEAYALALQPDGKIIEATNFDHDPISPSDVFRLYAPVTPVVSIATGVAQTDENSGAAATFVLTLSSAQSVDLKVAYTVKGTAQNGVDYAFLKGTAKIKAGKTTKTIPVTPVDRGISGGGKATVKLTVTAGAGYLPGSPDVARVKIIDND